MIKLNQSGLSPLVLLFILVLGIIIMWEINQYMNFYSPGGIGNPTGANQSGGGGSGQPVCLSGEEGNCNDTNDVFLLP